MEKFNQNHKINQHFETAPSLPKSKPFSSRLLKNYTITDYTVGIHFQTLFSKQNTRPSRKTGAIFLCWLINRLINISNWRCQNIQQISLISPLLWQASNFSIFAINFSLLSLIAKTVILPSKTFSST